MFVIDSLVRSRDSLCVFIPGDMPPRSRQEGDHNGFTKSWLVQNTGGQDSRASSSPGSRFEHRGVILHIFKENAIYSLLCIVYRETVIHKIFDCGLLELSNDLIFMFEKVSYPKEFYSKPQ